MSEYAHKYCPPLWVHGYAHICERYAVRGGIVFMQKNTIDASDDLFIGHTHMFERSFAFICKKNTHAHEGICHLLIF